MWMTSIQAADALGVTPRAVRKRKGLRTREEITGRGRGGQTIYYWIEISKEPTPENCKNILEKVKGTTDSKVPSSELSKELSKEPAKGTAKALQNKEDEVLKGTNQRNTATNQESVKLDANKEDTEMLHTSATFGATSKELKGTVDKNIDINGLDESSEFIDIESAATLEGVTRQAIDSKVRRNN